MKLDEIAKRYSLSTDILTFMEKLASKHGTNSLVYKKATKIVEEFHLYPDPYYAESAIKSRLYKLDEPLAIITKLNNE
jgi:hypothetical protein